MSVAADHTEALSEAVRRSFEAGQTLRIAGSGSKSALSAGASDGPRARAARMLSVAEHRGVLEYRPEELVITARAGTPLREVESILAEAGQYLPFEPPRLHGGGTLGGAVAAGLSGPGRPWRGAVRDALLGVELVNGRGECLRFGGQVMKNVAGYDVARLQAGAFGTLGLILAVSVKVLPRPDAEETRTFELDGGRALALCRQWARQPLPVSATCHFDGRLSVRLSGAEAAVRRAARQLGGESARDRADWGVLRDQRLPLFGEPGLWRASLPPAAPMDTLGPDADAQLVLWAGAERWWRPREPASALQARVRAAGGHARPYDPTFGVRNGAGGAEGLLGARLRAAFDPAGVFNPGLAATTESAHAH